MFNDKIVLGSINVLQAAASNNAYVEGSLAKNQATLAYLALCQLPLANMLHTYITSMYFACRGSSGTLPQRPRWSDYVDFTTGGKLGFGI
jgi:hypothetical protein